MNQTAVQLSATDSAKLLLELESRQDEVIEQLDRLNRQVEQAIQLGQMSVCVGPTQE